MGGPFNVTVSAAALSPSTVSPCTVKLPLVPIVTVVPSSSINPVPKTVGAVHLAILLVAPDPVIDCELSIFSH